ncbi:MAG: histidine-type phosphatase [Candidatus Cryptobacteroides sp.]|nr:histidine-type phosphatase [Bacteroidales bacterium]MDY5743297.1 histidine-type phosphatase [Candidatus Cryptobacteroides sp.]
MKKLIFTLILSISGLSCLAQPEVVLGDPFKSSGLDNIYDFDAQICTAAPKGYEAFYISHYGRHGSRYPYTASVATALLDMLHEAEGKENLSEYGNGLMARLELFMEKAGNHIGELTDLGRQQQYRLAGEMAERYPQAFRKGAVVTAQASSSSRSILSMASFCTALARKCPSIRIDQFQGFAETQATAPNMGRNPLRIKGPGLGNPYRESPAEFMQRRFPEFTETVLGKMFRDPYAALGDRDVQYLMDHIYMLIGGMNSLPDGVRMDFSDIVTPETLARMWELDNYQRFCEYIDYTASCCSVFKDIIERADARLALLDSAAGKLEGRADGRAEGAVGRAEGADLRFGHDHVLMSLLMIADIDSFGELPENPDELGHVFQTFRSPMAANLHFVFYRPKNGRGPILTGLSLNGQPARLSALDKELGISPDKSGFYRWDDVKAWFGKRFSQLCD